jgi:catalase
LTVGPNGPLLLHHAHFVEQMAHFNREKVLERQPHAKGGGAFGTLETTDDAWRRIEENVREGAAPEPVPGVGES